MIIETRSAILELKQAIDNLADPSLKEDLYAAIQQYHSDCVESVGAYHRLP